MQFNSEVLSKNFSIWILLSHIFREAIGSLRDRSVGPDCMRDPEPVVTMQEFASQIVKNYTSLKEDLQILNKLMHIARNLLVTPEPEVAQDLCASVLMDQAVYHIIAFCVSVATKGHDEDPVDGAPRQKIEEISDLCR
jgi:hypothetical protein